METAISNQDFIEEYPFNEVKKTDIQAISKHLAAVRKEFCKPPGYNAYQGVKTHLLSASELISRYV
ncbi:Uncharacterized protein dnl_63190 [Desulfonema limicola]|uniref:Uncharacterized protein n=1 Tax=Desulfonema limicola TaxID=45656 RepID=A0A975GJX2_9BACT|nr:hypothetical protein [Desulfonema limicola]QTA83895.1 Uncharacterized protein dnl_63190 [Desulfonema limicola]